LSGKHFEIWGRGLTQRSYGGGPWGHVGYLLKQDVPRFGADLDEVNVTIFCNGSLTTEHCGFPPLDEKQSVRFLRKRKRLQIDYPSSQFSPDDVFRLAVPQVTREHYVRAFDDLYAAIAWGLGKRITSNDDFDAAAFLDWLEARRSPKFASDDDLRRAVRAAIDASKAARAKQDPWDQLDIDWDEMHSTARAILDQPEDWSSADDFSPHGNDTGADIFGAWGDYKNLNPRQAALELGWELSQMDTKDKGFWHDWVEINLALAFGHIKKSGQCHPALASDVHDVLAAQIQQVEALTTWDHKALYLQRVTRYADILERFITPG